MKTNAPNEEVAVIGGGPAGLATAAYLALGGMPVRVFEKSDSLGGRASSRERSGFSFNRGVHALYMGGPAEEVLTELQVPIAGGSPTSAYALRNGSLYPVPTSLSQLVMSRLMGPRDKLALARFFASASRWNSADFAGISVEQWLGRQLPDGAARALLTGLARTVLYSDSLDLASADTFIERLQLVLKRPVRYLDGGWQSIVDGLRVAAEAAGARVARGARVTAIEPVECGARLRFEDGASLEPRAIVVAVEAPEAARLLETIEPSLSRSIRAYPQAEAACLQVAMSSLLSERYAAIQDLDSARFLATQSRYARIAPAGAALLEVIKQHRPGETIDVERDQRALEDLLDLAQPGWRDVVIDRVFLPSMAASSLLPLAERGGMGGRPGARLTGVDGVFLAGDWVGPRGYLVDAALESAREAARLLLADFRAGANGSPGRVRLAESVPA
jgi:phytoene dehydrogenase-like protein